MAQLWSCAGDKGVGWYRACETRDSLNQLQRRTASVWRSSRDLCKLEKRGEVYRKHQWVASRSGLQPEDGTVSKKTSMIEEVCSLAGVTQARSQGEPLSLTWSEPTHRGEKVRDANLWSEGNLYIDEGMTMRGLRPLDKRLDVDGQGVEERARVERREREKKNR